MEVRKINRLLSLLIAFVFFMTCFAVMGMTGEKAYAAKVQPIDKKVETVYFPKANKGGYENYYSIADSNEWTIKMSSAKSSKSKVASIDSNGIVTAKAGGTATIPVKTKNNKKATLKIKVVDPYAPTKIKLNKSKTVKLKVGATLQLYTKLTPSTAVTTLTWASSNKKVATVDQNGKVVAMKKGTATIAVKTANGKIAKVKVKVVK